MFQTVFFLLLCSLLIGLGLHIWMMRRTHGKHIYLMAFLLLNSALVLTTFLFNMAAPIPAEGILLAVIFTESFVVVHCFVLVGVVHDSPTLAIVKALMANEPEGLTEEGLNRFIKAHPFVTSRLDALRTTGDVSERDGRLFLTARSKFILALIGTYARIIRVDRETG